MHLHAGKGVDGYPSFFEDGVPIKGKVWFLKCLFKNMSDSNPDLKLGLKLSSKSDLDLKKSYIIGPEQLR
jgi:hypothetical protein